MIRFSSKLFFLKRIPSFFISSALVAHGHTALAHSQPERSVGQGQNLEEDIPLRRYANHPAVDAFISKMAARHDFDAHALRRLFARARYSATSAKQVMPVASPEQQRNCHVLDALTTLAFDYPPAPNRLERARLFRQNLEDFLVWTRDIGLDPTRV